MADGVLSFPFRLDRMGFVATTERGSAAEVDEALAALTLTVIGERPMSPRYGVPDPAFRGLTTSDIRAGVDGYGPDGVTIVDVSTIPTSETTARTVIEWAHETDMEVRP